MEYDNTNKGIIGKNTRKQNDNHPDITGSINIEGKDYWLNGWQKKRKDGQGTFYSLSVKPKEERQDPPSQDTSNKYTSQSGGSTGASHADIGDEIPFAPVTLI